MGMTIGYMIISALGAMSFFLAGDNPVGGLFIGLFLIYLADFFVSLKPDLPSVGAIGEKALGFFHLGTGGWLMYLMFAVVLDFVNNYHLPT